MRYIEVRTTFEKESDAREMADFLLDEKLVACGQICRIESCYFWKGEKCETGEFMLIMKTKRKLLGLLEKIIKQKHPYEVAEFVCSEIYCSEEYANWIDENTI